VWHFGPGSIHVQLRPLAAVCAVIALLAAACSGAAAAPEGPAGSGPPTLPVKGSKVQSLRLNGDGSKPRWELAPSWALDPELLQGSDRFQELARKQPADPGEPTNVVMITADDAAASDLRWMPKTRALIGRAGVTFTDSLAPHPLCCPARAMMMTGQFAQNNGVRTNGWPSGGYYKLDQTNTLPVWMKAAGYETAMVGKYMNEYAMRDPDEEPPGWDHWRAPARYGDYDYYNYRVNVDGVLHDLRGTYSSDYYTEESEQLIRQMSSDDQPFFLWQSHVAPHTACPTLATADDCWGYPTPSAQYAHSFDHVVPPQLRDPSYNERDVSDKPQKFAQAPPLDRSEKHHLTELFQRRIESLQSVDDAVARTIATLDEVGELDNTLVIFASDNGYLLGEHRTAGKNLGYEPSLRVPLLMRGPSVPAGVRSDETVGLVDLAPTIAAVGGADPGLRVDGRNLLPVASGEKPGWDTMLVQAGPRSKDTSGWFFRGVRTDRYTYLEYRSGEVELYDRRRDPSELRNVAGDPAYARTQAELRRRLQRLQDCAGAECRQRFGPVPPPRAERRAANG
jgi:N-acetylglucosamine-6-sulfatase